MARDMLYDRLFRHAVRIPEAFRNWERFFRNLPVYDLTSIYRLGCDGIIQSWEGLPKRLPHDAIWAEWEDAAEYRGCVAKTRIGTRLCLADASDPAYARQVATVPGSHIYIGAMFGCIVEASNAHPNATGIGTPFITPYIWCTQLSADWTVTIRTSVTAITGKSDLESYSAGYLYTHWRLPAPMTPEMGHDDWPPFAAAALLHCRNIVTETVHPEKRGPTTNPRVPGEKKPRPLCSYKVLKLEVPRRMAERQGDDVEGVGADEPKVRFHLCRGHFKNLQHPRFKAKGWHWWPAHWKGSIELGRADKSYKLHSTSPEAGDGPGITSG